MIHSRIDHTKPTPGDHGLQFVQDPAKPVFPHDDYEKWFYSQAKSSGTTPAAE